MKKQVKPSLLFLNLLLLSLLFSCNTKRIGYFHNTYPSYTVKQQENKIPVESISTASCMDNTDSDKNTESIQEAAPSLDRTMSISQELPSAVGPERKISKAERKEIRKYIKENLKKAKNTDSDINVLLLVIIAILLPPLAVLLVDGLTGPFWLSILLTLLFYLPGLIYALYRIFRK